MPGESPDLMSQPISPGIQVITESIPGCFTNFRAQLFADLNDGQVFMKNTYGS